MCHIKLYLSSQALYYIAVFVVNCIYYIFTIKKMYNLQWSDQKKQFVG